MCKDSLNVNTVVNLLKLFPKNYNTLISTQRAGMKTKYRVL